MWEHRLFNVLNSVSEVSVIVFNSLILLVLSGLLADDCLVGKGEARTSESHVHTVLGQVVHAS